MAQFEQPLGSPNIRVRGKSRTTFDSTVTFLDSVYFKTLTGVGIRAIGVNAKGQVVIKDGGGSDADLTFDSRPPSTSPIAGLNGVSLNGLTVKEALQALIYPSQPPSAGLSITVQGQTGSSLSFEMMTAGGTLLSTFNWSAGRQASTLPIATVTVNGTNQTFTPPAAGATATGTTSVAVPRNTGTNYSMTVTASDSKTATAGVSVNWYWKRYWGFVSSATPTDADIRALTQELSGGRTRGATTSLSPTGSQYFVVAFVEAHDAAGVSELWVGGLNQTGAFNRTVRSFTNASGATANYIFYITKSPTSGSVSFEIK